jgi:hypothetical protein
MSALAQFVANAAEEGRNVILSMLVVGLVFLAVAVLGDLYQWSRHRRHRG